MKRACLKAGLLSADFRCYTVSLLFSICFIVAAPVFLGFGFKVRAGSPSFLYLLTVMLLVIVRVEAGFSPCATVPDLFQFGWGGVCAPLYFQN